MRTNIADPQAVELFKAIVTKHAAYRDARAAAQFFERGMPAMQGAYLQSVDKLLAFQQNLIRHSAIDLNSSNAFGRNLLIGVALLAVLAGLALALFITRSITRPLQRALLLAQTVSSRDLTSARADATQRLTWA